MIYTNTEGTKRGKNERTFRAVVPGPHGLALTSLRFQIERPVARTVGQTLQGVFVHLVAVHAFPSLLADARSFDADPVAAAVRIRTVHWTHKNNTSFIHGTL